MAADCWIERRQSARPRRALRPCEDQSYGSTTIDEVICAARRREVEDADGSYAESLKSQPEQQSRVEFEEFRVALAKLPQDQREALLLVGASGFSYEEAAAICSCAVGTIKSRVNRARTRLAELLAIDGADDFGPDQPTRAILTASGR